MTATAFYYWLGTILAVGGAAWAWGPAVGTVFAGISLAAFAIITD